ncbi:SWIM zinc finger family protein [Cohnella zeiphila]|uniref:SWIM zinc finger family protein n=1 Tax=Cohnella zeiphila TaxID=2761120 RepID=A0A7X0SN81_9BACL|nr:SWIM zinc finger family protein [Cohnella zeiphila]MBB6731820.1 SWIM zinc finger family protein [Cohnella zeiphila]
MTKIADDQWTLLIEDVAERFDDLTLKRGFQYYKQDRIREMDISDDSRRIDAEVMGSKTYLVSIDLDFFGASRCECPVQGFCKHMAAALLAYAEMNERPVQQLANARLIAGNPAFPAASKPQPPQSAAAKEAARLPEMSLEEWREWFQLCAKPYDNETRNPSYVNRVLRAFDADRPKLPPVLEPLFKLHASLFLLGKLMRPYRRENSHFGSYLPYYTEMAIGELQKLVIAGLETELPLGDDPALWERVYETVAYLRKRMLTDDGTEPYFADCYYLVWMNWISPHLKDLQPVTGELDRLKEAENELGSTLQRQPWLLAQCRMNFYLGNDPAAWQLLREAADEKRQLDPDELLYYLWELREAEVWKRLSGWLDVAGPLLRNRRGDALRRYFEYWEAAIPHVPDAAERMWSLLSDMLPWTQALYEEKLREHGRWREWMDLQLCTGQEPLAMRVTDLQPMEKEAPELLLPFYHQAVERLVLQKNRYSYKEAVRLLKRLQKLYKRLKRENRWETFFSSFNVRNGRLRALQEELRKGKLLS